MRRKTIIVLVITFMVTAMMSAFSYLYISQILRLRITNIYESATSLTHQFAYAANSDLPDVSSTPVDTSGKALLHTTADRVGKVIPPRPEFLQVAAARPLQQLRLIYSPSGAVY